MRTFAEIDLNAIENNFNALSAGLAPHVKRCCVIKADAYGHGAVSLAKFLHNMADYYAVATADEAMELRTAGITLPVMILGYVPAADYDRLIGNDVELTVFRTDDALKISDAADRLGKRAKIQIAVDTGMSRIGFVPSEQAAGEVAQIAALANIEVAGIFTHYATADCADKTFTHKQTDLFADFVNRCENLTGRRLGIYHISNSAAIIEPETVSKLSTQNPKPEFDMVRMGISLYGHYPSDEVDKTKVKLTPAMTLRSHIVNIKTVPSGTGISYGLTYHTDSERVIATVSAGYADGYPRALSNCGKVLVRGKYAPITGRVCMDQFMADVTDISGVRVDDEVVLMGGCGCISAEAIGANSASFNYEVLCNVSRRVPRVYIYNGKLIETVNYVT
ncbi:MAG: alanine racemase [Clostridia bacterium]|nr:alanine racemase [Clostridia bacterium]